MLTEKSRTAVDQCHWKTTRQRVGTLTVIANILENQLLPLPDLLAKKTAVRQFLL